MSGDSIGERYRRLRAATPDEVTIVLAAKRRTAGEVREALDAGAADMGWNYVQEAEERRAELGDSADRFRWHMMGHLQKNKINKALPVFDMLQAVDSTRNAQAINDRVEAADKTVIPILLEINIADEPAKSGIRPSEHEPIEDHLEELARAIASMPHVRLSGLMTMGPAGATAEECRPFFRRTRELFERLRDLTIEGVDMKHLSMGMSDQYRVAIEEGSTMIRIGTAIFGPRPPKA
jgi:pyridoxal phosphate enzyme (YggS family)